MKKYFLLILILTLVGLGSYLTTAKHVEKKQVNIDQVVNPTVTGVPPKISTPSLRGIFVPYWVLDKDTFDFSRFDQVIYFGIAVVRSGIDKQELGFGGLEKFSSSIPKGREKLLTVRMLNDEVNLSVLESEDTQGKLIEETEQIAEKYQFDGIVLDLELSNLINNDATARISNFVQQFYSATTAHYRKFYVTLYGDTFYRKRPYDVKFLGEQSDGIMIMAYDFHKSRGEPGANFPLEVKEPGGYDLRRMTADFVNVVPKEKLTVIFGMFGYDWLVDEKKRPIRPAKALSLNEIGEKFLDKCEFKNCVVKRDTLSKETEINYIVSALTPDEQNIYRIDYHIVWFEDQESVKIKSDYLKEKGINSFAFWAYSYF